MLVRPIWFRYSNPVKNRSYDFQRYSKSLILSSIFQHFPEISKKAVAEPNNIVKIQGNPVESREIQLQRFAYVMARRAERLFLAPDAAPKLGEFM